jgi:hypothetical protein
LNDSREELPRGFLRNTVSDAVMEQTSVSFVGPRGLRKERRDMAEFRSIKDLFRDPLIIALVLVGTVGVLAAVFGLSNYQNTEEARATNQPSTQSMPADTKPQSTQSDSQAPAITQPSTQAPATGETKTP